MSATTLEAQLQATGGAVKLLRNSSSGPYVYPVVRSEYSNWGDEQLAWQHTCVLFNQSYHMTDMYVGGGRNAGRMLTLAMLDNAHCTLGREVTFVWGEEDGGASKPAVERHVQTEIRATVSPVPYPRWPAPAMLLAGVPQNAETRCA